MHVFWDVALFLIMIVNKRIIHARQKAIEKYDLRSIANAEHQTYALGLKEVWAVDPSKHQPGKVIHTVGYPLDQNTYGGSFLYHMEDNMVSG